jgi:hypothetical protein
MDKQEIQRKAGELRAILAKYKNDLAPLEGELFSAIEDYHLALKEERLKDLRASMLKNENVK